MKTEYYKKHFISLCVMFILGNAVISLPFEKADKFTFLGFLISFIISLLAYWTSFLLPNKKEVLILSSLLCIWAVGDTFIDLVKFINATLLRENPKILAVLPFLICILFFCFAKQTAILKFCLISALVSVIAIVFFFGFTSPDFRLKNVIINSFPNIKNLYLQTMPYFKKITLPSLLLVIFAKLNGFSKKTAFSGMALGNLLLAFCVLNSVLLFGSEFAGRLSFPYASAISTVTFGNLFSRLDGFAYFIYFASCLIKITVSVGIIKASIRGIFNNS